MGLIPKTRVSVRKVAPMGDPIEIHVRDYALTIRKEDARNIAVEEVGA
jgi:Fe2+ transport system protein FeoA